MAARCIKMKLPNQSCVDILPDVFNEIKKWIQVDSYAPESGGYIVGYQHKNSNNISLEKVSHPYILDKRNRVRFNMRDPRHKYFLLKAQTNKSFYMGVWHTHPQLIPEPSEIDWNDWRDTLKVDKTGCDYAFFIIAGIKYARVWVGDFKSKEIIEIFECEKEGDLYK